jgi:hypothetical protein
MELKVACNCGQNYKFDVEPVNGQMPFAVNCPVCGADGTPLANQLLTQQVPAGAPPPPPVPAMAAPATIGPVGLSVSRPPSAGAPPPFPSASRPITPIGGAPLPKAQPKEVNLGLGILGAFLGAAVGGVLVYLFWMWAHFRFPWSSVGIGALAGYGARLFARGTDTTLGVVAAVLTGCSVVGTFYLMYGDFFLFGIISIVISVGVAYRLASE